MRVCLISIPKSGTNLVVALLQQACPKARLVDLMYPEPFTNTQSRLEYSMRSMAHARRVIEKTDAPAIFHSHMVFTDYLHTTLWELGVKGIFLVRDPRAVAVSFVDYVMKNSEHPAHRYFTETLCDMDTRLRVTIAGTDPDDPAVPFIPAMRGAWERYVRWLRQPDILQLRYEGLVGSTFGGWNDKQEQNIRRLVEHAGLDFDQKQLRNLIDQGTRPEKSVTFSKGGIHRWREAFTPELHEFFAEHAGDVLKMYRYDQ
ncbi:MAG: sulfotransferase domain-containing protein [Phycisphaerales bacterium]|nr:sulfotransferase domain-containing protein [Phycisphaerales bacterium]